MAVKHMAVKHGKENEGEKDFNKKWMGMRCNSCGETFKMKKHLNNHIQNIHIHKSVKIVERTLRTTNSRKTQSGHIQEKFM